MKDKLKKFCEKPSLILAATVAGAVGGGVLGVLAYYGGWLG